MKPVVAIFGSSTAPAGSEEYERAYAVGKGLGDLGLGVLSGGYFGTMEAVSKGAAEAATEVDIVGVLVPSLFVGRNLDGNSFLTKRVHANTLIERINILTTTSRVFVILPGKVGTMAELVAVWNQDYCDKFKGRAGNVRALLVCWRDPWEAFFKTVLSSLDLDDSFRPHVVFVDTPAEAVAAVSQYVN